MASWHEMDDFWITMAASMFTEDRWAAASAEVDQIIDLVELSLEATILDMGCGPGRHSLAFARRGFQVTGVDRTAVYLEEARRAASAEALNIEFIQGDMRAFQRPDSYDLALSLYTTFGYFEDLNDNVKVLRNLFQALRSSGAVIIEMMGKEVLARVFQERSWHEREGVLYLEERKITQGWRWIENRWIKIDGEDRAEYRLGHWLFSGAEITDLLERVGFSDVSIYGDLGGKPYDHAASRLVALGRKTSPASGDSP